MGIIVSGHYPFYDGVPKYQPSVEHRNNCDSCRIAFGEVTFNNRIDFYFCGHIHWYKPLYPIDRNEKSRDMVVVLWENTS